MNISAWAIHKPTPSILLFIMLGVAGLVSFAGLGIQSLPDMDLPAITVSTSLPGATPSQLETDVVRPLEDSIAGVAAVQHVRSIINDGTATITAEFEFGKDIQVALSDVRDAVTRTRSLLPADLQDPIVARFDSMGVPALTFAVIAPEMDEVDVSWLIDDTLTKALRPISGVAQVRRQGGVTREIQVDLDPVRLQALNVTAAEVSGQLRAMQQDAPGGRGDLGGLEQIVRTSAGITTVAQLGEIAIPVSGGRRLRLDEIATVRDTHGERRQAALLDGKPVVGFQVLRARGFDEVVMSQRVRQTVKDLAAAHPGIEIRETVNGIDNITRNYHASMNSLYEGAVLAVIVVWLFLRDWRATAISAIALPLSIIPTFAVMAALGYTLNIITLLALTLVIGVLVDDTIVEIENIARHLRKGKPPLQAALEAVEEIGLAVIATTLTLVAVFLPTAFVGGITGELFRQFGWTASVAVLFSLLVARLLTPLLAAHYMKKPEHVEPDPAWMKRYLATVAWCVDRPKITSAAAAAFFGLSLMMIAHLPTQFVPPNDGDTILVTVEVAPGSPLEHTVAVANAAREVIARDPDVLFVYAAVGAGVSTGGPQPVSSAPEVRTAQLYVRIKQVKARDRTQQEIGADLAVPLKQIPGARISVGGGGPGEQMQLAIVGNDPVALQSTATAIAADLRTIQGLGGVTTSSSLMRPEILIQPDFQRAAAMGVTAASIAQTVRIATTGDYDFNLPRLNMPERQLYIRVQLSAGARSDPETLSQLRVRGNRGTVPLQSVANLSVAGGPTQINRVDRNRSITITADLQGTPVGSVVKQAARMPGMMNMPAGVHPQQTGDVETMRNMFRGFALAMLAGVICVYAVMVLLFQDFSQPATVMAALPLAAGGALGSLVVTGFSLSLPSLIGLLMLIGIVTKNSILLVDYAIMARRDLGLNRTDAILDACHKRARPIIMTTVAMAAGMLPMALGLEGNSSFRASMAVVVIGGLLTSTVLSLLVVPVVFEIVDDFKNWILRRPADNGDREPVAGTAAGARS